jgi:hypothetical protein
MPAKKKKKKTAPALRRTPVAEITPDQQIVGAVFVSKVREFDPVRGIGTLALEAPLSAGDSIRIKGADTDLTQKVERMSVGRSAVQSAAEGEIVKVHFASAVRQGDAVYKL